MSEPVKPARGIEPERRVSERRAKERRASERRAAAEAKAAGGKNLPVPVGPPAPAAPAEPEPSGGYAAFAAQLLGQKGQKRGLKGGPPVLEEARSAYLETEWSGPGDRRTRAGRFTKTEI